jgi:hypothetical protein
VFPEVGDGPGSAVRRGLIRIVRHREARRQDSTT